MFGDLVTLHCMRYYIHWKCSKVAYVRIPGLKQMSYCDRCKILKLDTLELRRLYRDLEFCYKILHGFIAGNPKDYGLFLTENNLRGNCLKLKKSVARVNVCKYFFANRIVPVWNSDNSLPNNTVNAWMLAVFMFLNSI